MFERFSEEARAAVVHAERIARSRGDPHVGTAHLLLGVIEDRRIPGSRLLRYFRVSDEIVRNAVDEAAPPTNKAAQGPRGFTAPATRTLRLAAQEADALHHPAIGSVHLILALAEIGPSVDADDKAISAQVLQGLGVRPEAVRNVLQRIGRGDPLDSRTAPPDFVDLIIAQITRLNNATLETDELFSALAPALDLAEEEAVYLGRAAADGGDLLIGLAAGPDALVNRALAELGLDSERVRAAVKRARSDEKPG